MMRHLRRLSAFICMFLVFAIGVALVASSVVYITGMPGKVIIDDKILQYSNSMSDSLKTQVATLWCGLLFLLVSFTTIYLAIVDVHSSGRIKLESPGGRLTVSVSALENYLCRLGRNVDGVKELRAKIRRLPSGWALFARVTVWSDQNIQETQECLQNEIREGLYRMVGKNLITLMDIHVSRIEERAGRVGHRRSVDVEFTSEKGF